MLRVLSRLSRLRPLRFVDCRPVSQFADLITSQKCNDYCENVANRFKLLKTGDGEGTDVAPELVSHWQCITEIREELLTKQDELKQLDEMLKETDDADLKKAIDEDKATVSEAIDDLTDRLTASIVQKTELDMLRKCQLEFSAGAGGVESMIFAEEIYEMYRQHAVHRNWQWTAIQFDKIPSGGIRSALVLLEGEGVYANMRFEAGTHRVQRIPFNASIMHTSTMNLAVLPEPENAEVAVPSSEVKIEAMRASGPGGQNVNKRASAVRITHIPTGTAVHVMEERFQHMNIKIAYKRLAAILMQRKVDDLSAKTISARKLQVGSRARAEKIRTFNFKDDRITDHRLKMSVSHIEGFLKGGSMLDMFMEELRLLDLRERLNEEIHK
uniref:RF_PROK_I domain-containing protein n=1 Tax=Panagrellus redivivus TaxID=6233 RepID=A0A7E4V1C8_PANRE